MRSTSPEEGSQEVECYNGCTSVSLSRVKNVIAFSLVVEFEVWVAVVSVRVVILPTISVY